MSTRDFGSPEVVSLVDGDVRVDVMSVSSQSIFSDLAAKNSESIDEFRISAKDLKVVSLFGIYFRDIPVGTVSVWRHNTFKGLSLSYWVDSDFRRRGIAFTAVRLVLDSFSSQPVYAHVLSDNVASSSLLLKLGFVSDGVVVFNTVEGMKIHNSFVFKR